MCGDAGDNEGQCLDVAASRIDDKIERSMKSNLPNHKVEIMLSDRARSGGQDLESPLHFTSNIMSNLPYNNAVPRRLVVVKQRLRPARVCRVRSSSDIAMEQRF